MEPEKAPTATANILVNVPAEQWNEAMSDIAQIKTGMEVLKARQQSEYLTVDQVCEALKIGRSTFYSYKNTGKLKVSRIGKKLFVKQPDLEDAINRGIV